MNDIQEYLMKIALMGVRHAAAQLIKDHVDPLVVTNSMVELIEYIKSSSEAIKTEINCPYNFGGYERIRGKTSDLKLNIKPTFFK
jgi:hypothetical protein